MLRVPALLPLLALACGPAEAATPEAGQPTFTAEVCAGFNLHDPRDRKACVFGIAEQVIEAMRDLDRRIDRSGIDLRNALSREEIGRVRSYNGLCQQELKAVTFLRDPLEFGVGPLVNHMERCVAMLREIGVATKVGHDEARVLGLNASFDWLRRNAERFPPTARPAKESRS